MKNSILIFCAVLTTFGLTAFGFINWSETSPAQKTISCSKAVVFDQFLENALNKRTDPDLVYKVESRFMTTITKEKLLEAKSIIDILPKKATNSIESYRSIVVTTLQEDGEKSEMGENEVLNPAQIKLLQSTDYSTDIWITADYRNQNTPPGEWYQGHLVYYITIIPEKEAEFTNGPDALIEYLKENSKDKTAIIKQDQLQPGKVSFTVTKAGTIADVKLDSTSGYPTVDEALVELVTNMPGKWNPAMNSKGEKVDQKLVFFFGLEGC